MAKNETTQALGEPAGQQQRWDDSIVLDTIAAAPSVNIFAPPPGCVVQVEAWGFTIVTAITTAAGANAVFGLAGDPDGAGYVDIHQVDVEAVAGGTLTAGTVWEFNSDGCFVNGVQVNAVNVLPVFFVDANVSGYCNFDVSVAGAGAGAAGTVRPFIRHRFLVAPEQDFNESGY